MTEMVLGLVAFVANPPAADEAEVVGAAVVIGEAGVVGEEGGELGGVSGQLVKGEC